MGREPKSSLQAFGRSELKAAFRRILQTLYANTNISRREKLGGEMIKIIFTKLQDEKRYVNQPPEFRTELGEAGRKIANRVKQLFRDVLQDLKGEGIFTQQDKITLDDRSIAWVVGQLERGSLSKTDADVVGDAFEVFRVLISQGKRANFLHPGE